jgi:hypothetical protein
MRKNILLAIMAIALISLSGFEGFRYWKQHQKPTNDWQVSSQYNGVRGTSNTMLVKRADGYAEAAIQIPEFLMVCPDNASPYAVIDTGEPLWERTSHYYITYRFDGGTPKEELWDASENEALHPDDVFAKEAIEQSGLWLELPYGEHSERPVHFNLTGLAQAYKQSCQRTPLQ